MIRETSRHTAQTFTWKCKTRQVRLENLTLQRRHQINQLQCKMR
jgi:hypothetical protein